LSQISEKKIHYTTRKNKDRLVIFCLNSYFLFIYATLFILLVFCIIPTSRKEIGRKLRGLLIFNRLKVEDAFKRRSQPFDVYNLLTDEY
jgi:hypothetical protein